ncbi:MAG: hypothetical protein R6U96_17685 [Promethearchaeia archaeon]
MRWILDACTLIYLVKTNLFENFVDLIDYPLIIDSSVHEEVVLNGKRHNYTYAFEAEKLLKQFRIPVIPIDVSKYLILFRDAGETSCYILAKEEGICLTSDERAYKKFLKHGKKVIRLDTFYFRKCVEGRLTKQEFMNALNRLESVNATKPKSILFFMKKLENQMEVKK